MDLSWNPGAVPFAPAVLLRLGELRTQVLSRQEELLAAWRPLLQRRGFLASASNLAGYLALRRHDLHDLQDRLDSLGLASLAGCEASVAATLDALMNTLRLSQGQPVLAANVIRCARALQRSRTQRCRSTDHLFGAARAPRATRFMVTLSRESGADYALVRDLVELGMDCARINCVVDDRATWRDIIGNVRQAEKELGRGCKVLMELGGRRLRTGPVDAGPDLLHVKVKRDQFGDPLYPTVIVLDGSGRAGRTATRDHSGRAMPARLAVDRKWLARLDPGDRVLFRDFKGRKRELAIEARLSETEVACACVDGAYIGQGTELEHEQRSRKKGAKTKSGAFDAPPAESEVKPGDALLLTRDLSPGRGEQRDKRGRLAATARIGCTDPDVFDLLDAGQTAWIDGCRIGALIEQVDKHGAWLRVTRASPRGERIGADQAIHLPDTPIDLPALSARDLAQLEFVSRHADIVGFPVATGRADIDQLVDALAGHHGGRRLGIIAGIETRAALDDLPEIIAHGAGRHPFGITGSYGALAAEFGFEGMPEAVREIRALCACAHVPVVWSTPALESLVIHEPPRADITDTATIGSAQCLLLNQGPCVRQALIALGSLVSAMEEQATRRASRCRSATQ